MNLKLIFIGACVALSAAILLHSNILFIIATMFLAFAIIGLGRAKKNSV